MPKIDFGQVNNAGPVQPIPRGEYVCRIDRVERTQTKRGDEMWRLRLVVQEGSHASHVVQDNLVFSPEAMPRVKMLCDSLGIDTSGQVDLVPDLIMGRACRVLVIVEEYQGRDKNKVAFEGYLPHDEDEV